MAARNAAKKMRLTVGTLVQSVYKDFGPETARWLLALLFKSGSIAAVKVNR